MQITPYCVSWSAVRSCADQCEIVRRACGVMTSDGYMHTYTIKADRAGVFLILFSHTSIKFAIVQSVAFLASIWLVFVTFVLHGSHFEIKGGHCHNVKIIFWCNHYFPRPQYWKYTRSNHLPILLRLGNIDKLTFWVAAILDYKMATTKRVNQSILSPTATNVGIATKIEFLYCLACEILSKQLLDGVDFAIQDGGPRIFRLNGNICFWFQKGLCFPK